MPSSSGAVAMSNTPVPTNGNTLSPMARAVRRVVLLDRARLALGGAERIGEVLGIGRRAVNHKLASDRGLTDAELGAVALAIDERAAQLTMLAHDLRGVVQQGKAA